jgi:hypothetical protein
MMMIHVPSTARTIASIASEQAAHWRASTSTAEQEQQLGKLAELRDRGGITDAQFQAVRAQLLGE